MRTGFRVGLAALVLMAAPAASMGAQADVAPPVPASEMDEVFQMDAKYQAAVKANDADAMAKILSDDFTLMTGKGASLSKPDLLRAARDKDRIYDQREDTHKTVRFYDDTAIVTALLWVKGHNRVDGKPFDYKVWFTDIYLEREDGWQYVFGQASLPDEEAQ